MIERDLDYWFQRNLSSLTNNQLKIQCLTKLKTFKKVYNLLRIKSKCTVDQLKLE